MQTKLIRYFDWENEKKDFYLFSKPALGDLMTCIIPLSPSVGDILRQNFNQDFNSDKTLTKKYSVLD